jgi:hypothetical protein
MCHVACTHASTHVGTSHVHTYVCNYPSPLQPTQDATSWCPSRGRLQQGTRYVRMYVCMYACMYASWVIFDSPMRGMPARRSFVELAVSIHTVGLFIINHPAIVYGRGFIRRQHTHWLHQADNASPNRQFSRSWNGRLLFSALTGPQMG